MRKQIQEFLTGCLFIVWHSGDDVIQVIPRVDIVRLVGGQQEQTTDMLTAVSWLPQKR